MSAVPNFFSFYLDFALKKSTDPLKVSQTTIWLITHEGTKRMFKIQLHEGIAKQT